MRNTFRSAVAAAAAAPADSLARLKTSYNASDPRHLNRELRFRCFYYVTADSSRTRSNDLTSVFIISVYVCEISPT